MASLTPEVARRYGQIFAKLRRSGLPIPINAAARILAAHPDADFHDPGEAVRLAERAAELTKNGSPVILDTLAMAYASAGRFKDALETARTAYRLAKGAGNERLAEQIGARLTLYAKAQPVSPQE